MENLVYPEKTAASIAAGILHANKTCFDYAEAIFNSIPIFCGLGFKSLGSGMFAVDLQILSVSAVGWKISLRST